MMEFLDVEYSKLTSKELRNLLYLRKLTFKDRLHWQVSCRDDMEFDEYDGMDAVYLIAKRHRHLLGGVRLIDIEKPNMLRDGIFNDFFGQINLSIDGKYFEASRLFIDKNAVINAGVVNEPVSRLLLIAAINFCRTQNYEGIYTILTHAAYVLYRRYGWEIEVVETGYSEKNEKVYCALLPVDEKHTSQMFKHFECVHPCSLINSNSWPIKFICQNNHSL